jgi:hypothetical protein
VPHPRAAKLAILCMLSSLLSTRMLSLGERTLDRTGCDQRNGDKQQNLFHGGYNIEQSKTGKLGREKVILIGFLRLVALEMTRT